MAIGDRFIAVLEDEGCTLTSEHRAILKAIDWKGWLDGIATGTGIILNVLAIIPHLSPRPAGSPYTPEGLRQKALAQLSQIRTETILGVSIWNRLSDEQRQEVACMQALMQENSPDVQAALADFAARMNASANKGD